MVNPATAFSDDLLMLELLLLFAVHHLTVGLDNDLADVPYPLILIVTLLFFIFMLGLISPK